MPVVGYFDLLAAGVWQPTYPGNESQMPDPEVSSARAAIQPPLLVMFYDHLWSIEEPVALLDVTERRGEGAA